MVAVFNFLLPYLLALMPYSSSSAGVMHPFYVSVTEINYNASGKSLEISAKIFTDDLELTLNKAFNKQLDLMNPEKDDINEINQLLQAYMERHLILFADGKRLNFKILGFEREKEAIWSYFEAEKVEAFSSLQVQNAILYDQFKDQINLVHVTSGDKRRSGKVSYPKTELNLKFF